MKIIERLETLKRLNSNKAWVNKDLFKLMCSPDFAMLAYERLKSKPGNMTPGEDGTTLDATSLGTLTSMCEAIRQGTYKPRPVRRKFIPKPNGKRRPLGIPAPRDKIVQEMVREVLESIYDSPQGPTFTLSNHGFRSNRSCHTAIHEFTRWHGTTWLIEGDIESFFDNIDHHILIGLLRKRISDERFINLIWKLLRAGVREDDGDLKPTKLGTPQGGVLSPILANVYLHEFDTWVANLQSELDKGERRKPNPLWRSLRRKRNHLIATGKASIDSEVIKAMDREAGNMPTVLVNDPDFCRVRYTRYADDWIIGVIGSYELAARIKAQAGAFLADHLKLTLSPKKTLITHLKTQEARFLNFRLSIGSSVKRLTVKTEGKRTVVKRVTGWNPRVEIPVDDIIARLKQAGFCGAHHGKSAFPCSKKSLVALEDHEIIMRLNAVWRGIYNYYRICDGAHRLRRIMYILQYSCLKTMGHKHRMSVPRVIRKRGLYPRKEYRLRNGETKVAEFWRPQLWRQPHALSPQPLDMDQLMAKSLGRLTRSHLNDSCAVCAEKAGVEMHHVRALRKGNKTIVKGFNRLLSAINRKQIPLCGVCHDAVHAGRYDGHRLSDLAYVPQ